MNKQRIKCKYHKNSVAIKQMFVKKNLGMEEGHRLQVIKHIHAEINGNYY